MCDFGNLHVVKDLHVCLCHLHADVILRLFEIGSSGFEIQLVQLYLVGNLESREERHIGTQLERRRRRVGVGIGVISRQTATEREVLVQTGTDVREAGVTGCAQLNLLLTTLVFLLLDGDAVLDGVVTALTEAPSLLGTGCTKAN